MRRAAVVAVLAALLCAGAGAPAVAAGPDPRVPDLLQPVPGSAGDGFAEDGRYGPGHRGLDLRAPPGSRVRAPSAGRVHFAGAVAGRRWATVAVAPGVLVTVGPLDALLVRRGDHVAAGTPLGTSAAGHPTGADGVAALHLSLRVDGVHVDPAPHLRDRGPPWVAALVADGEAARTARTRPVPSPVGAWPWVSAR